MGVRGIVVVVAFREKRVRFFGMRPSRRAGVRAAGAHRNWRQSPVICATESLVSSLFPAPSARHLSAARREVRRAIRFPPAALATRGCIGASETSISTKARGARSEVDSERGPRSGGRARHARAVRAETETACARRRGRASRYGAAPAETRISQSTSSPTERRPGRGYLGLHIECAAAAAPI